MMSQAADPKLIDGWGQIAAHLSEIAGVPISRQQAFRYAHRPEDPLPVERMGKLKRRRVVQYIHVLNAWAKREWAHMARVHTEH